ncbi:MAG: hypothetical protein Q8Q03_01790 [bacterium]|nr:hypothetical protein [bacterium]
MPTISVPIPPSMAEFIENQIKMGKASNKAEVIRKAIAMFRENEAIEEVLRAQKEPSLKGDLRELAKKIKND